MVECTTYSDSIVSSQALPPSHAFNLRPKFQLMDTLHLSRATQGMQLLLESCILAPQLVYQHCTCFTQSGTEILEFHGCIYSI